MESRTHKKKRGVFRKAIRRVGKKLKLIKIMSTNSNTYGPLTINWTPSDSKNEVYVEIMAAGQTISQNNLSANGNHLVWGPSVSGDYTTSGDIYVLLPSGSDTPALMSKTMEWTSPRGGTGNANNVQIGTWTPTPTS